MIPPAIALIHASLFYLMEYQKRLQLHSDHQTRQGTTIGRILTTTITALQLVFHNLLMPIDAIFFHWIRSLRPATSMTCVIHHPAVSNGRQFPVGD
jgi:hypothetical protein